ncbi:HAD hydrolase [Marasmius fiardii PR-910]|nr:HAD hydrolase [Marasmius fiardii PR-910]
MLPSLRPAQHKLLANCIRRSIQSTHPAIPPLGFAFDIDGVLMAGPDPLPTARRALQILEGNNPFNAKIPYILLTNGGGKSETVRAEKLSASLGVKLHPEQIIQAHTVLKGIVDKYANSPVLVLGGKKDELRPVAESYGFRRVYTAPDVLLWNSSVWPFETINSNDMISRTSVDFSKTRIEAVLVFHDPRNWGRDVQIILDVIQSGGLIGGPYVDQLSRSVEIIFCNPDLLWKSDFPRPRLGQGAFKESFQAVYKAVTGRTAPYPFVQLGKPTAPTYEYAEKVLVRLLKNHNHGSNAPLPSMYMIGDNPASDIAGANAAGWSSILVHTGVYDPNSGAPPAHLPTHQAPDVEAAVRWALERSTSPNEI